MQEGGVDCGAPKCHRVAQRCQCPNAWTEYRSRTARTRKNQRLPKFTNAQHLQAYNESKANGEFDIPQNLAQRVRPCKNDAIKLCTWMVARTRLNPNRPFTNARWRQQQNQLFNRTATETTNEMANSSGSGRALQKLVQNPFVKLFGGYQGRLNRGNIFEAVRRSVGAGNIVTNITRYLGGGVAGIVFQANMVGPGGRVCAMKVQALPTEHSVREFKKEVYIQTRLGGIPNKRFRTAKICGVNTVPAYIQTITWHDGTPHKFGMVFMERIDGVLDTLIQKRLQAIRVAFAPESTLTLAQKATQKREYKNFLLDIATQLRYLVEAMDADGVMHGDLHIGNIGYILNNQRRPKLVLIDFGRTTAFVDDLLPANHDARDEIDHLLAWGVDKFLVWRNSLFYVDDTMHMYDNWSLNKALRQVGFPGSEYIRMYGNLIPNQPAGIDHFRLESGVDVRVIDTRVTGPFVITPQLEAHNAMRLPRNAPAIQEFTVTLAHQQRRLQPVFAN